MNENKSKKINSKDSNSTQTDIENIKICTYNIFWKIMKKDISIEKNIGKKNLKKFKFNIIKNIYLTKQIINPDIICIQEAEENHLIIKLFENSTYKHYVGYSEPEHILTIWKKKIYKKKLIADGEFESGRPFTLFVFEDIKTKIHFIFINIHPGHNPNTQEYIIKPIQQIINKHSDNIYLLDSRRIIISGDFNRDISKQIAFEPKKYYLKFNNTKYYFNPLLTLNKTCCSLNGYGYKKNCDQTIDTYKKPISSYQLNKVKWYDTKSSDHIAVITELKKF